MIELLTISHPFQTVDEFRRRAGSKLGKRIHRLAGKYPQLQQSCGMKRMLMALSVAWGLTGLAKAGNIAAFEHIDEALSPPLTAWGCTMAPPWGCVVVEGQPFFIAKEEQGVLRFLWDGFTIFIDNEGTKTVGQAFFDFADTRQTRAYKAMGEESQEEPNDYDTRDKKNTKESNNFTATTESKLVTESKQIAESIQAAEPSDSLAELVDAVIAADNMEDAKTMSIYINRCSVECDGEAQRSAMQQARRLIYYIDHHNKTINQFTSKKGTKTMGDSYTFNVQGDYVKGDKVMGNKYVGRCQDAEDEEHLKNALAALMDEEGDNGKPLFQTQAQWFAVYRILSDNYGWNDNALSEFCRRINALGMKWRVACKLDGIKKVNQTAPFYKAFSEWEPMGNQTAYDRQEKVASKFKELMEMEEA